MTPTRLPKGTIVTYRDVNLRSYRGEIVVPATELNPTCRVQWVGVRNLTSEWEPNLMVKP